MIPPARRLRRIWLATFLGALAVGALSVRDAGAHTWIPKEITSCYANTPDRQRNIYCYWGTYSTSDWNTTIGLSSVELHKSTIDGFTPTAGSAATRVYGQYSNIASYFNSSGLTPCTRYYFRQVHIATDGHTVLGGQKSAMTDCPAVDSGVPDTGTPDTGTPDTGKTDTGTPDTGSAVVDSSTPVDTSIPDDTSTADDTGTADDTATTTDSRPREDTAVGDADEPDDTGSNALDSGLDSGAVDGSVDQGLADSGEADDGGPQGFTKPDAPCECVAGPGTRSQSRAPTLALVLAALVAVRRTRRSR